MHAVFMPLLRMLSLPLKQLKHMKGMYDAVYLDRTGDFFMLCYRD